MSSHIVILITTSSDKEAKKISDILLQKKLIVCANIIGDIRSLYRWKGELEDEHESLIIAKGRMKDFEEVVTIVRENHSYEVPEVIVLPIIAGNPDYLDWIDSESGESSNKE